MVCQHRSPEQWIRVESHFEDQILLSDLSVTRRGAPWFSLFFFPVQLVDFQHTAVIQSEDISVSEVFFPHSGWVQGWIVHKEKPSSRKSLSDVEPRGLKGKEQQSLQEFAKNLMNISKHRVRVHTLSAEKLDRVGQALSQMVGQNYLIDSF